MCTHHPRSKEKYTRQQGKFSWSTRGSIFWAKKATHCLTKPQVDSLFGRRVVARTAARRIASSTDGQYSAGALSAFLNHNLIPRPRRAQILQHVLIRRTSVGQILMNSCYRLLKRLQSRKQGSGVLLNIVSVNLA